ncbi:MAG: helix-turn-helix domain-containing protein [Clostridia bacterium]|nr:helix-turn-helix domain-containing protein [Clostridia bacterium]
MKPLHNADVDALFEAILSLETVEECYAFFEDACTIKEILDISQRLKAAKMLSAGVNYAEISRETGMSTATISRVSKCLEYGAGGYRAVIERMDETAPQYQN